MPVKFENLFSLCSFSLWQAQYWGDLGWFGIFQNQNKLWEFGIDFQRETYLIQLLFLLTGQLRLPSQRSHQQEHGRAIPTHI